PEANIIFGTVIDDTLGDEVRVTVVAAGFDGGEPQSRVDVPSFGARAEEASRPSLPGDSRPVAAATEDASEESAENEEKDRPVPSVPATPALSESSGFDDEDIDIPEFLK